MSDREIVQTLGTNRLPDALGRCAAAGGVILLILSGARFVAWPYPVELLSHFQAQYFLAAVVCAGVLGALRRWRWLVPAAAAVVVAGGALLPYQPVRSRSTAWAAPPAAGTTIRLLMANVYSYNRDHQSILDLVEETDADLVIVQEVNTRWMEALAPIRSDYPHVVSKEDAFGVVVFSRHPADDAEVSYLGSPTRPTITLGLTVGGTPISVVTTHPLHPVKPGWFTLRNEQLAEVGALVGKLSRPTILIGDLNTTMWSPWYRRFREATGLRNAGRGFGLLASWPASLPPICRIPIDHCLISEGLDVSDIRLGPATGSDHLPLIVDVVVPHADATSSSSSSSSH